VTYMLDMEDCGASGQLPDELLPHELGNSLGMGHGLGDSSPALDLQPMELPLDGSGMAPPTAAGLSRKQQKSQAKSAVAIRKVGRCLSGEALRLIKHQFSYAPSPPSTSWLQVFYLLRFKKTQQRVPEFNNSRCGCCSLTPLSSPSL
jgi:hypothetical protein